MAQSPASALTMLPTASIQRLQNEVELALETATCQDIWLLRRSMSVATMAARFAISYQRMSRVMHEVENCRKHLRAQGKDPDQHSACSCTPGKKGGTSGKRPRDPRKAKTVSPFLALGHAEVLHLSRTRTRKQIIAETGLSPQSISRRIKTALEWEVAQGSLGNRDRLTTAP